MNRNNKGQFEKRKTGEIFEGHALWYDHKGYASIQIGDKIVKVHVYVWERANGKRPDGYEIHHIDENKANFELSNLQLLSHSDHQKVHAGWIKENGEWVKKPCNNCNQILPLNSFYPRKGKTPTAKCKNCHLTDTRKRYQRPEVKQRILGQKKQQYLTKKEFLCAI